MERVCRLEVSYIQDFRLNGKYATQKASYTGLTVKPSHYIRTPPNRKSPVKQTPASFYAFTPPHCQRLHHWQIFLTSVSNTLSSCAAGRIKTYRSSYHLGLQCSQQLRCWENQNLPFFISPWSPTLSAVVLLGVRNGPLHHFGPQRSQKSHHPAIFIMASSNVSLLCYS